MLKNKVHQICGHYWNGRFKKHRFWFANFCTYVQFNLIKWKFRYSVINREDYKLSQNFSFSEDRSAYITVWDDDMTEQFNILNDDILQRSNLMRDLSWLYLSFFISLTFVQFYICLPRFCLKFVLKLMQNHWTCISHEGILFHSKHWNELFVTFLFSEKLCCILRTIFWKCVCLLCFSKLCSITKDLNLICRRSFMQWNPFPFGNFLRDWFVDSGIFSLNLLYRV